MLIAHHYHYISLNIIVLCSESLNYLKANFPTIESPSKKQHVKEGKEEILPVIRIDNSVLPESSKFIKTDEMDV